MIRRVSLDITGRLPTPDEGRAFLENKAENKHDALIQSLLETAEYADFFANKWAAILRNKRIDKGTKARFAFHSWVHKKTKEQIKPVGLGAEPKSIPPDDDPRLELAQWMSAKGNPFFARALANRYWKHFFNRGLVEPEDDMRESNPPSNPELLNALARHFTESGYDLKALIFEITRSTAYRLSSATNSHNTTDRQNFSHYYPRRLNAEVLLDSIDRVSDTTTDFLDLPSGTRAIALPDNSYNKASYFLTVFGRPEGDSVCECERVQAPNLSQSLHLMNAADIKTKLTKTDGRADQLAK